MKNWKINYKPQSPNNIYGMVDDEYKYDESDHKMDIIIFWTLPPNTYGNEIKYRIKIDQNEHEMIEELPLRVGMDINVLEIVTVVKIDNDIYTSKPGLYSFKIHANEIKIIVINNEENDAENKSIDDNNDNKNNNTNNDKNDGKKQNKNKKTKTWLCVSCHTENPKIYLDCGGLCGTKQPIKNTEWECTNCTRYNHVNMNKCQECFQPR